MSRRPATFTQADVARVIRAAKQAGAEAVEVQIGGDAKVVVRLAPSTGEAQVTLAQSKEIIL
jgi:hypothetical protein